MPDPLPMLHFKNRNKPELSPDQLFNITFVTGVFSLLTSAQGTSVIWIYYLLLLATDICGLLLAAFTLPGLWLMLGAAAFYSYLTRGQYLGYRTLLLLLAIAAISEFAEIFVAGAGAKKAGASKWGIFGGLLGAILGGIFLTGIIPVFAPLSTVIGICLGTFLGAFGIEFAMGRPAQMSIRIGLGAARGRLLAIFGKVTMGTAMFLITAWTALPLGRTISLVSRPILVTSPTTQTIPGYSRNIASP